MIVQSSSPTKTPNGHQLKKKRVTTAPASIPGSARSVRRKLDNSTDKQDKPDKQDLELSLIEHSDSQPSSDDIKKHERLEAQLRTEIESLKAQLKGKDSEILSLKQSLKTSQEKVASNERRQSQIITQTAKQLHEQYSAKHVAKVQALKQSYDKKYSDQVSELELRNDELNREITGLHNDVDSLTNQVSELQNEVERERNEKDELVSAYDQYLELQQNQNEMNGV